MTAWKRLMAAMLMVVMSLSLVACDIHFGQDDEQPQSSSGQFGGRGSVSNDIDELYSSLPVEVEKAEKVKGQISLGANSLWDELPDINTYPLAVEGTGDVDIEIMSSGEKAAMSGSDNWLVECARRFNRSGIVTSSGKYVTMSVRSVPSGTGADYVISGKYSPDLWTPSNRLFGDYAVANGASIEMIAERLVGNTAGLLVRKGTGYHSSEDVVNAVSDGALNIGYTNPQTSAAGLNLLMDVLKSGGGSVTDQQSVDTFLHFNENVPFIAYTTQQMANAASSGKLEGMVSEYQAWINNSMLVSQYDFLPYGQRHDNPAYLVGNDVDVERREAVDLVLEYLLSDEAQQLATERGFNQSEDWNDSFTVEPYEVVQALQVYKGNKDGGRPVIAVFIADRSGSMSGDKLSQLKQSLTNGMQYINETNYVGLVSYSTDVTIELDVGQWDLDQQLYFQGAVDRMEAKGNTSMYEALVVGMRMVDVAMAQHPDGKPMIFLLSDGEPNGAWGMRQIRGALQDLQFPVYSIAYGSDADMDVMQQVSEVNEAATVQANSEDVVAKIKSLFNAQL